MGPRKPQRIKPKARWLSLKIEDLLAERVSDDMISQAVEFIDADEKVFFETLGLSFTILNRSESKDPGLRRTARASLRKLEKLDTYPPSRKELEKLFVTTKYVKATLDLSELESRQDLQKKGEKYFGKIRKKLFQKICVEIEACKWSKEILGDAKLLLSALIPLVGSVLGLAIPAIVITVSILIIKWGILKFCKCKKP